MFISDAFAQAAVPAAAAVHATQTANQALPPAPSMAWVPYALIIVVFYFLLFRPQQEKVETHRKMIANLKVGDEVVTNGGLIGEVSHILPEENELALELSKGIVVRIQKVAIASKFVPKAVTVKEK